MYHNQPHLLPPHWSGKPVEEFIANAGTTADEASERERERLVANAGGVHPHLLPPDYKFAR